ncbi:hypothetical protein GCM10023258_24150 [Terrabacter aeriphilus]|uniref:DUF4349 domain-containing protein n=1 Tax=Terrabacter aeriphilus TaxID=515662 RepID=A0ABP9JFR1_9MICO
MTASPHLRPLRRGTLVPATRRRLVVVLAVVALLLLSIPLGLRALRPGSDPAMSSGSADSVGREASGGISPGAAFDGSSGSKAPATDTNSASSAGGAAAAVVGAKIARTAWLGLRVGDLAASAARVRLLASGAGGSVTSENVVTADGPAGGQADGRAGGQGGDQTVGSGSVPPVPSVGVDEARLTLSVPAAALDDVLTQLSKLGSVSYRSSASEDVTDSYVDTRARIGPMEDGIDRVRALLAKATSLQQVITLESELTRRQADLDSLRQRLAELDRITTTSTVTVALWTDSTPAPSTGEGGFVATVRAAWEALLGSLTVILTGLAVLLPWLVVGVPLVVLLGRLWRRRATAPGPVPTSTTADPSTPASSTPPTGGPGSGPSA